MTLADWRRRVAWRLPGLAPPIAEEIAQHLDDLYRESLRCGVPHEQAVLDAAAALDDEERLLAESARATRTDDRRRSAGWQHGYEPQARSATMTNLWKDMLFALRMLRRQPGFAAVTVLTLMLGIGVNVAVFAILRASLLASARVERPDRLVLIASWTATNGDHLDFSYPLYAELRDQAAPLASVIAYTADNVGVAVGDRRERLLAEFTTANYFSTLGLPVRHGRGFDGRDERRGAPMVAIIGDGLWRSLFGADPSVGGRTLTIDGHPVTIVGVAPPGFAGFVRGQRADLWMTVNQMFPLRHRPDLLDQRNSSWLSLAARLGDATTREQLEASLTSAYKRHAPADDPSVVRTRDAASGDTSLVADLSRPLQMMMLVVGIVLVIAGTNVAGLLLARSWSRQQEMAIRQSLGASRLRVAQQMFVEAGVLAAIGAAAAVVAGVWVARALELRAAGALIVLDVRPDAATIGFTLVLAGVAAVVIGIGPALTVPGLHRVTGLRGEGVRVTPAGRWLRSGLMIVQIALSLVLVCGAGLFLRTLGNLRAIDSSLQTDRTIAANVNMALRGLDEAAGRQFYQQVLEAARRQPGVESAALAYVLPVTAGGMRQNLRARATTPSVDAPIEFEIVPISPDFFRTVGIPLVAGREFTAADDQEAPKVIVINEQMRQRFWPSSSAVGETFVVEPDRFVVVGVSRDTKYRSLRERARMTMYVPHTQQYMSGMNLLVRSALPVATVTSELRDAVRSIDPAMPLYNVRTLAEHVNRSLYLDRLRATLVTALAVLALGLAAIGLYGVVSFSVAQRRRELGIRMALGASRDGIVRMLLAQWARLGLTGVAIGAGIAIWVGRYVASQLYGVSPSDPGAMAVAIVALLAVTLAAAALPAWRATRIDPVAAMRED